MGPVGPGKVALYWVCLNRESISFAFLPIGPSSRGTACMCFSLHLSDTNQKKADGSRQNQELFVCPTTSFRTRHGLRLLMRNTHDTGFQLPSNRARPRRYPYGCKSQGSQSFGLGPNDSPGTRSLNHALRGHKKQKTNTSNRRVKSRGD